MPQPSPASSAFLTQEPSAATEPEGRFLLGGLAAPVVPPTPPPASLLSLCDPFAAAALPFYQHVLNHHLARAYVSAMAWPNEGTNQACVDTVPVNPAPYLLSPTPMRLPLLALWPVSGRSSDRTLHRTQNVARYRAAYVLPGGLTFDQHKRVGPMLKAAVDLLILATERGALASYESATRVWEDAGVSRVNVVGWEIGSFAQGEGIAQALPALEVDLEVESVERWDSASGLPLWSHDLAISAGDPGGGDALDDLVQLESENEP